MPNHFIDKIVLVKGESGQYHYVGKSNNGETLFTSENFSSKSAAKDAGMNAANDADALFVDGTDT